MSNGTEHRTQKQTHTSKAGWFEQKHKNESVRQGNHFLYTVLEKLNSHTRKCIDRLHHPPNCRQQPTAVHLKTRSLCCTGKAFGARAGRNAETHKPWSEHKSNLNTLDFIKGKESHICICFLEFNDYYYYVLHNPGRCMSQNSCGAMDSLVELVLSSYPYMDVKDQTQVSLPVRQAP